MWPLGCLQVNQKIMSLLDCSYDQAELLKFGEASDKMSAEELNQIITSVVTDWCTEIRARAGLLLHELSGGSDQADPSERRRGPHRRVPASCWPRNPPRSVETLNPFKKIRGG
ncbi:MAG: hypothetical protein MZV70_46010 [Desulfobacterales bacterium]|nr:hypothetical protein [Desulfobacterales bacterium]